MLEFGSLWWVVILAALAVWIASAVVWMVLPHHKSDFGKLPDEDAAMKGLGEGLAPGQYRVPHCGGMEEMKDPAYQEKEARGPLGLITIFRPGPPNMGKMLGLWFGYTLLVAFTVSYLARMTLMPGVDCYRVFRFTSTVAFAIYALPPMADSIWMGKPWKTAFKSLADGVGYALITGGIFCWAWPDAA